MCVFQTFKWCVLPLMSLMMSQKFVGRGGFSKCNQLPLSFNGVCALNVSNGVFFCGYVVVALKVQPAATFFQKTFTLPSSIASFFIYVVFPSERCNLPLLILRVVLKKKQNLYVSKVATCCPIS